jgi:hypothetical protein
MQKLTDFDQVVQLQLAGCPDYCMGCADSAIVQGTWLQGLFDRTST